MKQLLLILFLALSSSLQCSEAIRLHVVQDAAEIDCKASCDILVKSFMDAYEDVPLAEINPNFTSTGDVRRFYENYFASEFAHFKEGHLYWVEAFYGDKLVGWATFELEQKEADAAYMNLLVVRPKYQRHGVGKALTFSIRSELFANIKAINLLIRRVNSTGYKFYYKIGFFDFDYKRDDNFVDTTLLTGLRWELDSNQSLSKK